MKPTGASAPLVKSSWVSSPGPARWTSPRSRCLGSHSRAGSSLSHSRLLAQPNGCGLIGHFADRSYLFLPAPPRSRHILWSHRAVRIDRNDGGNAGYREGWMRYAPESTGTGHLFPLPALQEDEKEAKQHQQVSPTPSNPQAAPVIPVLADLSPENTVSPLPTAFKLFNCL